MDSEIKPSKEIPDASRVNLRLLATSDLHMHLTGYDYYADCVDPSTGLTRTATLIQEARQKSATNGGLTLLFDNGDSLQGTPFGDMAIRAIRNPDQPHPLMQSFKHLRYDTIGLGNHDFNFGLDPLLAILAQAPCPVVCSNLHGADGQTLPGVSPYCVLDREVMVDGQTCPLRVGVLSFLPPQTMLWDAHLLQGRVIVGDIFKAARREIAALKQQSCDVIVALAHCGLDEAPAYEGMENAVLPLAALDGIDAIIAGHTHLHLPGGDHPNLENVDAEAGSVHGKPTVMPGTAGSHLGVIDLELTGGHEKSWVVDKFDCALHPVLPDSNSGSPNQPTVEDPVLSAQLAAGHAETRASLSRHIGVSDHSLHSYFSFFAPDRSLAVVAAAQASALRPLLVATDAHKLPLLSAASPSKFGGRSGPRDFTDIPAGNLTLRHIMDLYAFPNELRAVIVTGRQIIQWLEHSARQFHQITPGTLGSALVDRTVPGHDFDVLHGLTWQIDLSVPALSTSNTSYSRIFDVRHGDKPIQPDQQFVVALNNYRANGGGGFDFLKDAKPVALPCLNIRDLLSDYLSGKLASDPFADTPCAWRFKPMPGTSVTVQTGLDAWAYLDELSGRNITDADPTAKPDGFLHLTLPL